MAQLGSQACTVHADPLIISAGPVLKVDQDFPTLGIHFNNLGGEPVVSKISGFNQSSRGEIHLGFRGFRCGTFC